MPNHTKQSPVRYQIVSLVICLSILSIGTSRWTLIHTMTPGNVLNSLNVVFVSKNNSDNTKNASSATNETYLKILPIQPSMPMIINRLPNDFEFDTMVVDDNDTTTELVDNNVTDVVDCSSLNSKGWSQTRRIGNIPIPEDLLHDMMQPHLLLHHPSTLLNGILDQTLCYPTGRFRNVSAPWNASDSNQIQDWQFRLLYLAIHRLFHQPALAEYQRRRQCSPPSFHLNNYDYECPNAKFLVIVLNTMGMGATFRKGAMPAMYTAVATGRIPLFIQARQEADDDNNNNNNNHTHYHNGHGFKLPSPLQTPFHLTSCDRRDLQCVFLPTSPCVLSWDDLRNATVLDKAAMRDMKRWGMTVRNNEHVDTRVLLYQATLASLSESFEIHNVFHKVAHQAMVDLINYWKTTTRLTNHKDNTSSLPQHAEQWNVLNTAVQSYGAMNATKYRMRRNLRALQFYLMRPNPVARREMDKQLLEAMSSVPRRPSSTLHPPSYDMIQRQYFGLPIRGSDKCVHESTCLSFSQYMDLMMVQRQQHGIVGKQATILLTSEETRILPMRFAYTQNLSFPFDVIVNDQDIQPGTGRARKFQEKADAIMISSLVAIKLQLQANVLVGNCCSNFHALLFAFAREGCGADPDIKYQCLDQMKDPRFRICCAWTRTNECNVIRAEYFKSRGGLRNSRKQKRFRWNATID